MFHYRLGLSVLGPTSNYFSLWRFQRLLFKNPRWKKRRFLDKVSLRFSVLLGY